MRTTAMRLIGASITMWMGVASAAEQASPKLPIWPGWHGWHPHAYWWVIPLMMFVLALVFILSVRHHGFWFPSGYWWHGHPGQGPGKWGDIGQESALDILNKRYARGEIDKQEYEEKVAAISASVRKAGNADTR